MKDARKTKAQLIEELCELRRRAAQAERERETLRESAERFGTSRDHLGNETASAEIAEHKRTEQALRESEERYRALFEQAPDSIVLVDAEKGTLVDFNDRACENLGYTRGEFQDLRVADLEIIESHEQVLEHAARIVNEGGGTFETRHKTKTGEIRDVLVISRGISIGGREGALGIWRDVTEHKRAEEALRESEELFRTVVAASKDAIVAIDREGLITIFNPAAEKMFGRRKEEMLRQTLDSLLPEEYRLPHRRYVKQYFTTGVPHGVIGRTIELPALRGDGTVFPVELSLSVGQRGAERFVLAIIRDITNRKQAEEELRKFKTITDLASFGAAMADLDGHLIYVNDAFAQMHGYTPAELAGRHLSIFHAPEQMERVNTLNARLAREGQYLAEEVWHKRKDGSVFPALMSGTLIRDEHGDPAYISATAVDVSQRVRAQELIRESDERYRTLVESIGDGVALVADGKVQYASPSVCLMTGRPAEEIIGRSPAELVAPEDAKLAAQRVQAVLAGEPPGLTPYGLLTPNGERRYIEVRSSLIRQEGQPTLLAVLRDITERKQMEEQQARLEAQLREANKMNAVGQVAAGIAHDFGNLLAVARNGVSRLQELASADRRDHETLDVLARTVEEATSITQSLLVFTHRLPAERQAVDLCRFLEESLPVLRHLLPGTLRVDTSCDQPAWVNADAGQLRQVLLNLTINARDAMPEGGMLYIRVDLVAEQRGAPGQPPAAVRLTVRDNGAGIPEDIRPHIFEPFFSTKPGGRGTGLGLATVQSIVRDHGGQITVESQVGRGATFTVVLPPLALEAIPTTPSAPPPRGHGQVVLLEESNRHIRRLMNATLRSWGYQTLIPPKGVTVCETYRADPTRISLLVLNADPPAQSGIACMRELRAAGRTTPVILTGKEPDPRVATQLDQWTVLLRKPFQMEEFGRHLRQLLAGQPGSGSKS